MTAKYEVVKEGRRYVKYQLLDGGGRCQIKWSKNPIK